MEREIKSKLLETVNIENKTFEITYIDIPNYTYIKTLDERVTYPNNEGFGNIISNVLSLNEYEELNYSVTPHNEAKSSMLGVSKSEEELKIDDLANCQKIVEEFQALIVCGLFSGEAKKVFEEFSNKVNELIKKDSRTI